nr:HDOD domain-containing protein [Janthinobacterium sp. Marseille]
MDRLPATSASTTELARPVNIPPRPALLIAVQHEMNKEEPHLKKIARVINRDVAIAGNLLSIANSAMFNLGRHIETVEDAITLIGLNNCNALMTSLMMRRALSHGKMMMPRFWDVSEKRSWGMMYVARLTHISTPELAYNFGLFSDIGIPLMMASFPNYAQTLNAANKMEEGGFIELENQCHRINHAVVGGMLAEHWSVDPAVVLAIKKHHTHSIISDLTFSEKVRQLIAVFYLVDKAIQEHRHATSVEWQEGGHQAREILNLSDEEVEQICVDLKVHFSSPLLS